MTAEQQFTGGSVDPVSRRRVAAVAPGQDSMTDAGDAFEFEQTTRNAARVVFAVPEPAATMQILFALGALALLRQRGRHRR